MTKVVNPKTAYKRQKANAIYRGISWELTYDQWLEWWGDDLSNRGVRHDCLQMQRFGDSGPYALDNIRKGYPKDNVRTKTIVAQNKETEAGAAAFRKYLSGRKREVEPYDGPKFGRGWQTSMFGLLNRFRVAEKD